VINSDADNPHNIFLAEGIYSSSITNDLFPLPGKDYTSIVGENTETTIIDAENSSSHFLFLNNNNINLENLKLINGTDENGFNYSFINGGSISSWDSQLDFKNLYFENNESFSGGCICSASSSCNISDSKFINNLSWQGNDIYNENSDFRLQGCLFITNINDEWNNSSIANSSGSTTIINCTFIAQQVPSTYRCISSYLSSLLIFNSIFYNDIQNEILLHSTLGNYSYLIAAYNDIKGGESNVELNGNYNTIYWLEGNIDTDPLYCDTLSGNFYLQENSPCIDAGTAYYEWNGEVILDLSPDEYYGDAPDMGAFEWEGIGIENCILNIEDLELTNYPNPFNPSTTISFNLNAKDAKDAKIEIYNLKGQKVTTLECSNSFAANTRDTCSTYNVVWNGTDQNNKPVGSGVYFYKLKAGKLEKTRKCLLIK
jgi:hypothetical protein